MEGWLNRLLEWFALPQTGLSTVFVVAFISATLLPMGSEPAVFGYAKLNPDHFWLVMPRFRPEAFEFRPEDFLCLIGVLGLFVSATSWIAGDEKLIAEGDPRLYESLSYHNA